MCSTLQGAGIIGSVMKAEQKVAEQGEKLWKKLPGITKKDKCCRIHLQAGSLNARTLCLAWKHAVRLPTFLQDWVADVDMCRMQGTIKGNTSQSVISRDDPLCVVHLTSREGGFEGLWFSLPY